MSTSNETKKKISLQTSDGEVFAVEEDVAIELETIMPLLSKSEVVVSGEIVLPIPKVHSWEMTRIIDFCTKHVALKTKAEHDEVGKEELKKFYAEYVKEEDTTERIMELMIGA